MSSSWNYPPRPFLDQVLKNCPDSGRLYLELWDMRDDENNIVLHKKDVVKTFLLHPLAFKRKLLDLCLEAVCSMHENEEDYYLELVGWDENFCDM